MNIKDCLDYVKEEIEKKYSHEEEEVFKQYSVVVAKFTLPLTAMLKTIHKTSRKTGDNLDIMAANIIVGLLLASSDNIDHAVGISKKITESLIMLDKGYNKRK